MLWTLFVILLIMWALGLVTSYTMGGFVHILWIMALIGLVVNLVQAGLNRIAPGRSSTIEVYDQLVNLVDGRSHNVEWRRGTDGETVVLLDDKEIIRTVDRASEESFDGFTVINAGGDYAFSQIAIFGTLR